MQLGPPNARTTIYRRCTIVSLLGKQSEEGVMRLKLKSVSPLLFVFLFGLCLLSGPLFAQVNTGRILGTITDQTGGVIAGATVTVTNTGTGVVRTLMTN